MADTISTRPDAAASAFAAAPPLTGDRVALAQVAPDDTAALELAASDGRLWEAWYTSVPAPGRMRAEIDRRLGLHQTGAMAPWTVRDAAGHPVGMTTFMNIDAANRRLEIGHTWIGRGAQGTGLNPEMKLLLLTRAFDELECIAVEFRTHWHNRQSRDAILRLGAHQDGVLRNHSIGADGTLRDTVVFSIVRDEWPTVRLGLRHRLTQRDRSATA